MSTWVPPRPRTDAHQEHQEATGTELEPSRGEGMYPATSTCTHTCPSTRLFLTYPSCCQGDSQRLLVSPGEEGQEGAQAERLQGRSRELQLSAEPLWPFHILL